MSEPMTRVARRKKRQQLLDEAVESARAYGLTRGRSMKCMGYPMPFGIQRHASDDDGCKNDGSGCLCECHDPTPRETP